MQLQGKFIAVSVPAVTIVLLLLGAIVYSKLVEGRQVSLEREISLAAERIDLRVDSIVQGMRTNATLLADAAPVVEWFSKYENNFYTPRIRNAAVTLLENIRNDRPEFRELRLVGANGLEQLRVADSSLINLSKDETGTAWFSNVVSDPTAGHHETVASHADDGSTTITISSPVYEKFGINKKERAMVGHVVIDVDANVIAKKLSENVMDSDGFVVFFNEELDIIHAPDGHTAEAVQLREFLLTTHHGDEHDESPSDEHDESPGNEYDESHEDEHGLTHVDDVESIELNNQSALVRHHVVRDGLESIIVSSGSTLQSMKTEIAQTVGVVTATAIVCFSAFFSWLVYWVVVAPVGRLQSSVTELSEGRLVAKHQSTRKDEIGQLARSFSHMSEQLSVTMQQLKETSIHNEKLAYQDGLTGLPNRRYFHDIFNTQLAKADANSSSVAVIYIDLDNFKQLNDTIGHQAGDELLVTTAERLQQTITQLTADLASEHSQLEFVAARLAGDEFVVLLSGFQSNEIVALAADQLQSNLCRTAIVSNTEWSLEASIGIALYPEHTNDGEKLLAFADRAMYEVKREQKSSWCVFTPSMQDDAVSANKNKAA